MEGSPPIKESMFESTSKESIKPSKNIKRRHATPIKNAIAPPAPRMVRGSYSPEIRRAENKSPILPKSIKTKKNSVNLSSSKKAYGLGATSSVLNNSSGKQSSFKNSMRNTKTSFFNAS